MDKVSLKGSKTYIYYDFDDKIIGRQLTKSNLKEKGSDNSLYFGAGNKNIDSILLKMFEVNDLRLLNGKKFKLKLLDINVEFEFNINDDNQRQLKLLNEGRFFKVLKQYNQLTGLGVPVDDTVFLLDMKNKKLFIKKKGDIVAENIEFESKVKKLIEKAKKAGIREEDYEGYISTHINARNSRVQKKFREELFNEFGNKCALCDINKNELLIASHIVPYHKCPSVREMIDKNNGLLLCVTHDALFDKNYISFNCKGKIEISNDIDKKMYELLNINSSIVLDEKYLTDSRVKYLTSHKVK